MSWHKFLALFLLCSISVILSLSCSGDDEPTSPEEEQVLDESFDISPIITAHYLSLDAIKRISRFRSLIGHDYTDPHESCRSMKHYYEPLDELDWTSLEVLAPARSKVIDVQAEFTYGWQVWLVPEEDEHAMIMLFHLDPVLVEVGDIVEFGEILGNHASPWTMSDIAIILRNNAGTDWRLVSQFELISDELWADYAALGFDSREIFIISAEERDADAVGCGEGGGFNGEGILENWVSINNDH